MSAGSEVRPPDDSWVVALHSSEHDVHPSGSGLIIDRQRILTCAHVARSIQDSGCEIWVAFPKSKKGPVLRSRVAREHVVFADSGAKVQDLAVLHLSESVPPGVDPVPLRDPASASLLSRRWWAFGFPQGHPAGNAAQGSVGEVLANDLLRIDRKSRYGIESGFSGAGVWSPEYRAVVAVVTEAENRRGDGQAIPLHHLEACFPGGQVADLTGRWSAVEAGDAALSAWGWSLTGDPEAERHWSPRARGVTSNDEHGHRFQGRTAALQVIKDWLGRDRDRDHRRMLVVTGAPGAGKSAVLGRIVTTADADAVRELPPSDTAVRAAVGSLACAVHAKGKTALEVATEIARAASAELPDDLEDFPRVLHAALIRQDRRFNVIIDALDEAVSLPEARNIIRKVILPITETFSDVDARVVAGSRRAGSTGDLLGRYRESSHLVDLDDPKFYAQEDLTAYALATLQLVGDERPENEDGREGKPNPYSDARVAGPVAARIAELSAGNFLVAGLTARARGMADDTPKSPDQLSFSPRISDVIDDYLELIPEVANIDARDLLTALAFAESPGLPISLWREAIQALGYGNVTEVQLARFTRMRAASFLIESSEQDGRGTVFRLFHQALNDALLNADEPGTARQAEEEALTRAFLGIGRDGGWERAPMYLLRSLPMHAARSGLVGDLLADDDYLLHADLRRVIQVADHAARDRTLLLGHTPEAAETRSAAERAAMFGLTEALDGLGAAYGKNPRSRPYQVRWTTAKPTREDLTLRNPGGRVTAVCAVPGVDGRMLLATGSGDRTVRLWDSHDGALVHTLNGHVSEVTSVCAVRAASGRALLATAGGTGDGTVRLWEPHDGALVQPLKDFGDLACAVPVRDGRVLLATSGHGDRTVRLWDPDDGTLARTLNDFAGLVWAMCTVPASDGRALLATAGSSNDETVRLWDPDDGTLIRSLKNRLDVITGLCAIPAADGRVILAVVSRGGSVRLWDLNDGTLAQPLNGHASLVTAVCAVPGVDGRMLLATGSGDGTVRLCDPDDGTLIQTLNGHTGEMTSLCAVPTVDGRALLATGSRDGTARLWDLRPALQDTDNPVSEGSVTSLSAVPTADSRALLATGSRDWTARWGRPRPPLEATDSPVSEGSVTALSAAPGVDGRMVLVTGCGDGTVRLWDSDDGTLIQTLNGHTSEVTSVCAVPTADGRALLVTAGSSGGARLWDPDNGARLRNLIRKQSDGHTGNVRTVCAVPAMDGRALLAAGCSDGGVGLWDPDEGTLVQTIQQFGWVTAVCAVPAVDGRVLLAANSQYGGVKLWDPDDGTLIQTLNQDCQIRWPTSMCAVPTAHGRSLLAIAGSDDGGGVARLCDPLDGTLVRSLEGHTSRVTAVCALLARDGRALLATGSDDQTVRVWDAAGGRNLLTVPVHHMVTAVTSVSGSLAVGLSSGVLVIELTALA